jgi:hypothetical protein
MKKNRLIVMIFVVLQGSIVCYSQSIYTDALKINELGKPELRDGKATIQLLDGKKENLISILSKYFPNINEKIVPLLDERSSLSSDVEGNESRIQEIDQKIADELNLLDNPFFKLARQTQSQASLGFLGLGSSQISKLGGLPVTTFADGLAQFMIERANEEINVWFFRKFKDDLDESIELRTIFPLTNAFVQITEPYQYAQNLHLLREAFKKDLTEIIDNLEDLANLEKYNRIIERSDDLKIVLVGLAGASIVSKIKNGVHPADVIDSLGKKQYLGTINNNLLSSLIVFSTLSQSLRSTEEGVAYIPSSEFKENILSNDIAFRIFLGLLYQQLKEVGFTNNGQKKTIGQFLTIEKNNIIVSNNIGLGLLEKLNIIEGNFKKIKDKSDTVEVKYLEWYDFYASVLNLVEFGIEVPNILPIATSEGFLYNAAGAKRFIYSAKLGNEIFRNVNEKNFSLAVMNFSILYDTMIYRPIRNNQIKIDKLILNDINQLSGKKDAEKALYILSVIDDSYSLNAGLDSLMKDEAPVDYKAVLKQHYKTENIEDAIVEYKKQTEEYSIPSSKFIKYGAFMAAVADADKPEDVKAALNAAALPAGSSSIKRQTPFNVSINSYLGLHLGKEKLDGKGFGTIWGVSAPVGVAVSWGSRDQFKDNGSFSIFGSLIDIGAVASFRLTNDEGVENLPEFTIENIIAPGIYAIYGIPKAPISIGFGYQRGPQLRGITSSIQVEGEPAVITYDLANGYRWNFFVAVDIPLFNLYTKSK